jgi:aminopeptidase N
MNRYFITLLILISSIAFSIAQPWKDFSTCKHSCCKIHENEKSESNETIDIIYLDALWSIDPEIREISGDINYVFTLKEDLSVITLDLSDTLIIDSILFHGETTSYSLENDVLTIYLSETAYTQNIDSLRIIYHGVPRVNDNGAFAQAVHDSVNWISVIWTLSEPYGAKEWWPCNNGLNDKIDSIDIEIHCPDGFTALSNGILIDSGIVQEEKYFKWKHNFPIVSYLVAIAVTNYTKEEHYALINSSDSVLISNYYFPESDLFLTGLNRVDDVIYMYSDRFGDYEYKSEKYGHAQFMWRGGMEHQTISFMHDLNHHLTAHELAHHWFGNLITCASWEDIWLNEGFADYLVGLTYESMFNGYWWPYWKIDVVDKITSEPGGSVYCSDTTDISRIFDGRLSYKKGSYILHMLRYQIGDDAFFSGVNSYLNDPQIRNSFAETGDLIYHLESAADTSLSEYFNDWFYGEGFPYYKVNWFQSNDSLTVVLTQNTSHESVSFFEMDIPIQVFMNGADTILRLKHQYSGQQFIFSEFNNVDSIKFDPDLWIITRDVEIINSIVDLNYDKDIKIFPNPFDEFLVVEGLDVTKNARVEIYSSNGKLIFETTTKKQPELRINTSNFPVDNFVIRFFGNDFIKSHKIQKIND